MFLGPRGRVIYLNFMPTLLRNPWLRGSVVAFSLTALALAGRYALVAPQGQKRGALEAQIRDAEKEIKTTLSRFSDLQSARQAVEHEESANRKLRNQLSELNEKILGSQEMERLLNGVGLGSEGDFSVTKRRSPSKTHPNLYAEETVTVDAVAPFSSLIRYMDSLENQSPFIRISSLRVQREPSEGADRLLRADIRVEAVLNK